MEFSVCPRSVRHEKTLILGVNGFIGHHLSQRLMGTTDWEVYGMIQDTMADLAWKPKVAFANALRSIFEAYRHDVAAARHLMD